MNAFILTSITLLSYWALTWATMAFDSVAPLPRRRHASRLHPRLAAYASRAWGVFLLLWALLAALVELWVPRVTVSIVAIVIPRPIAYYAFFPTAALPYRAYPLSCALLN